MPSYIVKSGVVNDEATGFNYGRKLARSSNGDLHCVWTDKRGSYYQIYYAKSTDGGQNWTETAITSENYNQFYPSIAIDSNDYIHVVWQGKHSGSSNYYQIRYRKYTTSWQAIENLTSENYSQFAPSIAIDSNNYIHIVWYGMHSGSTTYGQIRYRKYTTSWQAIENLTLEGYNQLYPSIAIDSNDYIHIVWQGRHSGSTTYGQIRYRKYTTSWQAIENLTLEGYDQLSPSIAIDSNDYIHVVWQGRHSGSPNYYQIRYRKYTTSWQAIENLTSEGYDQCEPSISIDSNNYIHVVWYGLHSGSTDYTQIRYILNNGSWQTIENLTSASNDQCYPGLIWANYPIISTAKTNRPKTGYAFVWTDLTSPISVMFYKSTDLGWDVPMWLTGWTYRKKITISGSSGAGTNYQVLLKVGESAGATGVDFHVEGNSALFSSGQDDSGDLRFTASDGTTLLDFWVEKVEGTSPNRVAHCWVKVSDNLDTNKDIYCYYGNPSATNVSNLAGTFIREIDGAQPLKGSWYFDEGSGTTAGDSSGNNNNGTIYGATWVDGKFGKALSFDGVNDYVDAGNAPSFNLNHMTLAFWVYQDTATAGSTDDVITKGTWGIADSYGIHLNSAALGKVRPHIWIGRVPKYFDSATTLSLNNWHHIVQTYDGSYLRLYINGVEDGNSPLAVTGTVDVTTAPLLIGAIKDNAGALKDLFQGKIDEVLIFNRALSTAEISDLYNNYGYTTIAYPGRVLVRKYVSPEPAFLSAGAEEVVVSPRIMTPSKFW